MHGISSKNADINKNFENWLKYTPATELEYVNPIKISRDLDISYHDIQVYLNELCDLNIATCMIKTKCINCNEVIFINIEDIDEKCECENCEYVFTPGKYIKIANGNYQNINDIVYEIDEEYFRNNAKEEVSMSIGQILNRNKGSNTKIIDFINSNSDVNALSESSIGEDKMKKIFISHCSKNRKISDSICDLLKDIKVPTERIYYSSYEETGAGYLENCLNSISSEFKENELLVIFILSKEFYKSNVCLAEMGATWVTTENYIPIILPPLDYSDVNGAVDHMKNSICLSDLNLSTKLDKFKDTVEDFIGIEDKVQTSEWTRYKKKFMDSVDDYNKNLKEVLVEIEDIRTLDNKLLLKINAENNTKNTYMCEDIKAILKIKDSEDVIIEIDDWTVSSLELNPLEKISFFISKELENKIKRSRILKEESLIEIGYYK